MAGRPPTRDAPPFGKRLAALRKKQGITQADLAEQLGITQQTVTHYERRTANPSIELVQRLAAFFDVKAADLIENDAPPERQLRRTTHLERALDRARTLPRKKQKVIAELIETYVRANS